jgi:hypothetical protein
VIDRESTGILRNLSPFPPPSSIASIDLDKEVLLPVLVPVISSVSLQEATEAVRGLVQIQARHEPIFPFIFAYLMIDSPRYRRRPINGIRISSRDLTINLRPSSASNASRPSCEQCSSRSRY